MSYDGEYDVDQELKNLRAEVASLKTQRDELQVEHAKMALAIGKLLALTGFKIDPVTLKAVRIPRPAFNDRCEAYLEAHGIF